MKQIPNFILAAPIIALSVFGLKSYIQTDSTRFWSIGLISNKKSTSSVEEESFVSSKLSVHMYLWAFMLLYVVTTMHIQVIIRFFTSLPPLYWYVGDIWIKGFNEKKNTFMANVVLGYFVLYGLIGIVLFSGFLPPA
jgi:phosphatidylinositol glycan class V